jgi:hypothetical protein
MASYYNHPPYGQVAEWFKAKVLKTFVGVTPNLTLSATINPHSKDCLRAELLIGARQRAELLLPALNPCFAKYVVRCF